MTTASERDPDVELDSIAVEIREHSTAPTATQPATDYTAIRDYDAPTTQSLASTLLTRRSQAAAEAAQAAGTPPPPRVTDLSVEFSEGSGQPIMKVGITLDRRLPFIGDHINADVVNDSGDGVDGRVKIRNRLVATAAEKTFGDLNGAFRTGVSSEMSRRGVTTTKVGLQLIPQALRLSVRGHRSS